MPRVPTALCRPAHPLGLALAALACAAPLSALADEYGRVISSTPVVMQVAVPRQVCSQQPVLVQPQTSGAGAVMGAIAGGAMGNAIGDGNGRAAATLLGVMGGAMLGNRIENTGVAETRYVQQCSTQTFYENRTAGYQVVYEYAGKQYSMQMPNDPGSHVRLEVSPVITSTTYVVPAPAVVYRPAPAVTVVPWVGFAPRPLYGHGYGHGEWRAHGGWPHGHGHWR